jgi:type IV pilus assembly protein PilQ
MHWLDAMELILRTNNLWYEEFEDYIKIIPLAEAMGQATGAQGEKEVNFNTREVTISAVFFEVNGSKLRQAGMSWDFFRNRDVNLSTKMSSSDGKSSLFQVDFNPSWDFADIMAVFKTLESDQIGEIIANPQITVQSGEEGRIQVGSDIAVTVQDFAGNAVTQFFSTGTIIKVTPTVMNKDSVHFTHLDLQVERSSSSSSGTGLEIQKSVAETVILLLDGEETVIGGLYTNEEDNSREGIPFLKDLPWWFFGLRYVFGFESKSVVKKELLMLLKSDLLPTLEERLARKLNEERNHILMEKSKELRNRLKYYQKQYDIGK